MAGVKVEGIRRLVQIAKRLRVVSGSTGRKLQEETRDQVEFLLSKLREYSPKETGTFAGKWDIDRRHINQRPGAITSVTVINDGLEYSSAIEYGVIPGNRPWPSVPRKKSGRARTVESQGRIWSSTAELGVVAQLTDADKRQMQTAIGRASYEMLDRALDAR